MKKICLINPPLDKRTTSKFPMSGIPLGIAFLAAYIRQNKISVAVIDAVIEKLDFDKTAKKALGTGAKIIGISCLTENRYSALETLKVIKKLNSEVTTIIGGLHATFLDELILKNYPFVDIVVRGEGEITLKELIKKIEKNQSLDSVQGISFRKEGKVISNPSRPFMKNIENLPFPAYDLFPMKDYELPPDIGGEINQTTLITTSRGCPMGCKFCETTHAWGRNIRSTSAEKLFEMVKYVYKKFGIDYIRFADDLFTLKKEKVIKFCQLLIDSKLPIKFRIQARVDTVDQEELYLLKKAGCDLIEYGVESGSNKVLKEIGKNITIEKIKRASYMTRNARINLKYFLIVGSLKECSDETWETFKLIEETTPDWIGINALTIYPGTEVYEIAKKQKLINEDVWINYINPRTGNAPLYTKNYSKEEMIFLAQLCHVWACRNSPKRKEYPLLERILASILRKNLVISLVKNKSLRKISANIAWIFSPILT